MPLAARRGAWQVPASGVSDQRRGPAAHAASRWPCRRALAQSAPRRGARRQPPLQAAGVLFLVIAKAVGARACRHGMPLTSV